MTTILLVDDTERILTSISRLLRSTGYVVVTAEDGEKAMEILMSNHISIDLIICDLNMPNIDGLMFYRWLANEFPDMAKKFMFHTSSVEELENYEDVKNIPRLDKPGKQGSLLASIKEFLQPTAGINTDVIQESIRH